MTCEPDHIDRISDYCDRWCERCPMTQRCAEFTRTPNPGGIEPPVAARDTPLDARQVPARNSAIVTAARDYAVDAYTWVRLYGGSTLARTLAARVGPADSPQAVVLHLELDTVADALAVVEWDSRLIPARLHRALCGKDVDAEACGSDAFQTDANGSAKLALLLAERSEAGWRLIARWAPETKVATHMAETLAALRADVEHLFPHARRFMRPGFDTGR